MFRIETLLREHSLPAILTLTLATTLSTAHAATYTVSFDDAAESSSDAISRDRVLPVPPSIRTERLHAGPDGLSVYESVETEFYPSWSTAGSGRSWARASVSDLRITGPQGSGPVTATFHFLVHVSPSLVGGYAGNNGHGAAFVFRAESPGRTYVTGDVFSGNHSSWGNGAFSGYAGGTLSTVVSMTGTFPVNQDFSLTLRIEARCTTYGNASVGPGISTITAGGAGPGSGGVRIGDASGRVATLPDGFALSSTEWNISDSHVPVPSTAVASTVGSSRALSIAPNPTTAGTTLRFSLARGAQAELRIYDVRGRLVRTIDAGALPKGEHVLVWDGRDAAGAPVPSGTYFGVLRSVGTSLRGRIVILR